MGPRGNLREVSQRTATTLLLMQMTPSPVPSLPPARRAVVEAIRRTLRLLSPTAVLLLPPRHRCPTSPLLSAPKARTRRPQPATSAPAPSPTHHRQPTHPRRCRLRLCSAPVALARPLSIQRSRHRSTRRLRRRIHMRAPIALRRRRQGEGFQSAPPLAQRRSWRWALLLWHLGTYRRHGSCSKRCERAVVGDSEKRVSNLMERHTCCDG